MDPKWYVYGWFLALYVRFAVKKGLGLKVLWKLLKSKSKSLQIEKDQVLIKKDSEFKSKAISKFIFDWNWKFINDKLNFGIKEILLSALKAILSSKVGNKEPMFQNFMVQ